MQNNKFMSKNQYLTFSRMGLPLIAAGFLLLSAACTKNTFEPASGICGSISDYPLISNAGYAYVEENAGQFLVPDQEESVFLQNLEKQKQAGARIVSYIAFLPSEYRAVGNDTKHEEILSRADITFRRAQMTGAKYIVWNMSGGACRPPEGFPYDKAYTQLTDVCKRLGDVAVKYDIILLIEPINSAEAGNKFINTLAKGGRLVEEVNHPHVQLLCDIYHMLCENDPPEDIITYGKYIRHCHVAERETRSAPGVHKDNFKPYLGALKQIGYTGAMSVECKWQDFEKELPNAILYLKQQAENL